MNLQLFTKWYAKYLIFGICCLILLIIPLIRGPWFGTDVFFFSRLAENPSFYDSLSFGGRDAIYEYGTSLVLSIYPSVMIEILPFILGILSFLVFRQILKNLYEEERIVNISLLLLVLSPTFIYLFSFTNKYFISMFLVLCSFYFLTTKQYKWFSIIILAVMPIFNIFIGILSIILMIIYLITIKKEKNIFFWSFILLFLIYILGIIYLIWNYEINLEFLMNNKRNLELLKDIFYDLGNNFGLGIFLSILAMIGVVTNWEKKYSNLFLFWATSILIIFSLFIPEAIVLLNIIVILFAARGLIVLMDLKWSDRQYKKYIVFLILSGLVFSSVSQINNLTEIQPTQEVLEGIYFLKAVSPGTVFTDSSRGIWMNYAGKENIIDENYLFAPDVEERYNDINKVYLSRNFDEIKGILDKYSVDYIWIDQEMKENIAIYYTIQKHLTGFMIKME